MSQSFRIKDPEIKGDFGTTKAAKMYFSMSEPSPADSRFPEAEVNPVSFDNTTK